MPCSKASITKTYKCDKDGCLCIPTNGATRVCLSVNETGGIVRCDCDCGTKCECNENCTCINTAGLTCICVCRNEYGRIKTCEDCSCQPKQAETQSCKGKSNVNCCCNTSNKKCACLNCSCCEPGKNKCGKGSCVATCKGEKVVKGCECKGKPICACNESSCKCSCAEQEDAFKTKVCARKACCGKSECEGIAKSCVCQCKDKQGENVCCDDCKCDGNNRCDKEGCVCIPKSSAFKSVKADCCEDCDEKCKCSCVGQKTAKKCSGKDCVGNCKCQGNAKSCVCLCKNKEGENVCCDDCKCDNNNICDKKGCVCVPKEDIFKGRSVKPNCCENCNAKCKCSCVNQEAVLNANICGGKVCVGNCMCQENGNSCICICMNKQGESIWCDDCKCDGTKTCNKKGCVCVPRGTTTCKKTIPCKSCCSCRNAVCSCVCLCKDKQEFICCDDCKCDATNTCDMKACVCVRKVSSSKSVKYCCCEKSDEKCKCSCVEANAAIKANCAGKNCRKNCKCQGYANTCVCICKNEQGETVCCDDCKCDENNICDKKGCVCVPKEDFCKGQKKPNCCENCNAKCKCSCIDQEAVFNAKSCDGKICAENCSCKGNANSCVCICKNKQGETVCCEDCKCEDNNICGKKECACIPSASVTCNKRAEPKRCC